MTTTSLAGRRGRVIFGLLLVLGTAPAQAQRHEKAAATSPMALPVRLQPLFGGLTTAQATALVGTAQLDAIAASFASRAEASTFFSTKGLEYLAENQPDTAAYRFNIAWLLDPQNPAAYRGLGLVASAKPTPDQSIDLLTRGLALAPNNALLLDDLGSSYLIRYRLTHKKKDLTQALELLQRGTIADSTNALAWQQLAQARYDHGDYVQAWAAIHKGRAIEISSLDFTLISELLAKQPDPEKVFK